jgi:hypothetical protein
MWLHGASCILQAEGSAVAVDAMEVCLLQTVTLLLWVNLNSQPRVDITVQWIRDGW